MATERLKRTVVLAAAVLLAVAAVTSERRGRSRAPPTTTVATTDTSRDPTPPVLVGGLTREISAAQLHRYSLPLAAGQYLHLVVDQLGVDLELQLLDPSGRVISEVDWLDGPWGPENLYLIAEVGGTYRLNVRPWQDSGPGRYAVSLQVTDRPGDLEREHVGAAEALAQAVVLQRANDRQSLPDAASAYKAAAARWRRLGEPLFEAISALRAGRVYSRLGEIALALEQYERSLDLLGDSRQSCQEASALISAARVFRLSGRPDEALSANRRALALYEQLGYVRGQALALNNVALLLDQAGEIDDALELYQQALQLWERLDRPAERATTLHNMGSLYSLLGEHEDSLVFLQQALLLRRKTGDRTGEAASLIAIGWVHHLAGEPESALPRLEEALRIRRASEDRRGEAAALDRLATVLVEMDRFPEAMACYQEAEAILRQVGDRLGLAHTLANLGWLHERRHRPRRALDFFAEALPLLRDAGDRAAEAATLAGRARAQWALGNLEAARSSLETSLALVESQSRASARPRLRSSFIASRYDRYELYINLLMSLHQNEPEAGWDAVALGAVERSRSRGLLAMLRDADADLERSAHPDLLARRLRLGARLDEVEKQQAALARSGATEKRLAAYDQELRVLLLELEGVRAEMRRQSPRYAALTDPVPVAADAIQSELLDRDTALLVFSLGESRSFVWLVTHDERISRTLPPRREIELWARRSQLALASSHLHEARKQAEIATSRLAQLLLEPVAAHLDAHRLVVVADGALHYVPFGALPAPGSPGAKQRPLLADHEVVRVPSLAVLAALRAEETQRSTTSGLVAVVADPVFDTADPRVAPASRNRDPGPSARSGDPSFPRLVHSLDEAQAILGLVSAEAGIAALGFEASRETLLSGRLSAYRILHLATHALLDTDTPYLSSLVFSRFDADGRPRDGRLRLHELYELDLEADLVVLSACRTALGREVRGEGLVGLAGGFMHAGAPRVVVSVWSVSDRATAELMVRFYEGMLERGLAPAAALRQAQLSLADEPQWRAPHFWAGFVLLGEWRGTSPPLSATVANRQDSHFARSQGTEEGKQDG